MATSRSWRTQPVDGPHRALPQDIADLNQVFSDSFTERYRKDGMVGVRVPFLNPTIWRYAIEDGGEGAMLWRGPRGNVVAFNMVHHSGAEGWMGPLAVRTEQQGSGFGKEIVTAGIDWLRSQQARVIGLETMPRTMDNIGFYSRLGFVPGRLTLTTTVDAMYATLPARVLSRLGSAGRNDALAECRALVAALMPGYDYTREISLTHELGLGDTVLLHEHDRLVGFALAHAAPLVEGRVREDLRVLKLVAESAAAFESLVTSLADLARRSGTRRVAFRVQGEFPDAYQSLIRRNGQVRWTDLRMSFGGFAEGLPPRGVVLSNWEI
jgi:GNAT superfamily N-acetyltransferase